MGDGGQRQVHHIRRRILATIAAFAGVLVGVAMVGSPAQAFPTWQHGYGYVFANDSSSAIGTPYTAVLGYQYNSAGGTNTVTRTGIGVYTVRFPYLGPYGTPLVSAYGSTEDRCKIGSWSLASGAPGYADTVLTVRCYTRLGVPINSLFTASYTWSSSATRAAYLWNDQPTAPLGTPFTPSLSYQYNSEGMANSITHVTTGSYRVRLAGLTAPTGSPRAILVNAYGEPAGDASTYCAIDSSPYPDPTDGVYDVGCFSASGARIDSMFVLTYVESGNHLLAPTAAHATAITGVWCSPPAATVCGVPTWPFDTDSVGTITATSLGDGEYKIMMPMPLSHGNVQVGSSYLGDGVRGRCKVKFWNVTDGVRVRCDDIAGAVPESVTFEVSFVQ